MSPPTDAPARTRHSVDLYVGLRVRMRRRALHQSQGELAQALGLTFQQVQKYERGANRISASKLFEIARALKMPVGYFFAGLETADSTTDMSLGDQAVRTFLASPEGIELAETFPRIRSDRMRHELLHLVRTLSDTSEPSGPGSGADALKPRNP